MRTHFKRFPQPEIDVWLCPLGSDLYLDKNQPQAQILTVPLPQYQIVFFNLNNKILSDINVRTALSLATDNSRL